MNRQELEELIDDYISETTYFPTVVELADRYSCVVNTKDYDNIVEDRWNYVFGHGTINEGH